MALCWLDDSVAFWNEGGSGRGTTALVLELTTSLLDTGLFPVPSLIPVLTDASWTILHALAIYYGVLPSLCLYSLTFLTFSFLLSDSRSLFRLQVLMFCSVFLVYTPTTCMQL